MFTGADTLWFHLHKAGLTRELNVTGCANEIQLAAMIHLLSIHLYRYSDPKNTFVKTFQKRL